MLKTNPCYRITIFTPKETITITDPLTCHITVTRGILSDSQNCNIQITNLSPSTRRKIFKDAFVDALNPETWNYVHVEAGYNGRLALIFKGRVMQAYSSRAGGSVDVITEIQAMYLDAIDNMCSYTFKAGTKKIDAFQTIASKIPNVIIGNVGELKGEFLTDTTFDGNALDCLATLTGGASQIDNGVINCILTNEVIDVPVPVITDETGLLDTPMRRDANLEVKMLFQPDLIVNQLLEIKSELQPDFNGQFKVVGFTHDLNFGEANPGTRITTANLYIGPLLPGATITDTQGEIKNNFNKVKGFEVSSVKPQTVGKWLAPVKGVITSKFGYRVPPKKGASSGHKGIDIGVGMNTPVKATQSGVITASKWDSGYGNYIEIYHGIINGISVTSRYGHLNQRLVAVGTAVKAGQVIAKSGNTGVSTGPHLHFEIRENGVPVNPKNYVRNL